MPGICAEPPGVVPARGAARAPARVDHHDPWRCRSRQPWRPHTVRWDWCTRAPPRGAGTPRWSACAQATATPSGRRCGATCERATTSSRSRNEDIPAEGSHPRSARGDDGPLHRARGVLGRQRVAPGYRCGNTGRAPHAGAHRHRSDRDRDLGDQTRLSETAPASWKLHGHRLPASPRRAAAPLGRRRREAGGEGVPDSPGARPHARAIVEPGAIDSGNLGCRRRLGRCRPRSRLCVARRPSRCADAPPVPTQRSRASPRRDASPPNPSMRRSTRAAVAGSRSRSSSR